MENLRYINVYIVSIIYCCWKLKRIGIWKFKTVTFVNLFRKFDNSKLEIWKLMILLIPIFDIILIYWEISILVIPFFEINFQEIFNVNDDEYKNSLLNSIFSRVTYIIACIILYNIEINEKNRIEWITIAICLFLVDLPLLKPTCNDSCSSKHDRSFLRFFSFDFSTYHLRIQIRSFSRLYTFMR